jgi:hypothetical protein
VIPFPKMHIAQSVLNRISNALEESGPLGMSNKPPAPVEMQPPPFVPNSDVKGVMLDQDLSKPPGAVGVDPALQPGVESGMITESAIGGSPLNGALLGAGF